jgi:hypothetical protein
MLAGRRLQGLGTAVPAVAAAPKAAGAAVAGPPRPTQRADPFAVSYAR